MGETRKRRSRSRSQKRRSRSQKKRSRKNSRVKSRSGSRKRDRGTDKMASFYKDRFNKDGPRSWGIESGVWQHDAGMGRMGGGKGNRGGEAPIRSTEEWDPSKARNRDLEEEEKELQGFGKARKRLSMLHDDRMSMHYNDRDDNDRNRRPSPTRWDHDKFKEVFGKRR